MNTAFYLAALTLLAAVPLAGCDQVVSSDGLPYADHIVVQGSILAGSPIGSILITHTLPLNSPYSSADAAIPDASVSIETGGLTIPLTYVGSGYFRDPAGHTVASGATYKLVVDWHGLHTTGTTTVPEPAKIDSVSVTRTTVAFISSNTNNGVTVFDTTVVPHLLLTVGLRVATGVAYKLTSDELDLLNTSGHDSVGNRFNPFPWWGDHFDVDESLSFHLASDTSTHILSELQNIYELASDSIIGGSLNIRTYDGQYYTFLQDFRDPNPSTALGVNGQNPRWTVTGDGIGAFIGMADRRVPFTVR